MMGEERSGEEAKRISARLPAARVYGGGEGIRGSGEVGFLCFGGFA